MQLHSETILATITEKARSHTQDGSRHLLCPLCRVRTKLYTLDDGRRKCSACGKKFQPEKKTDLVKLQQYADLILTFALNLTARQAEEFTGIRYRLVAEVFDRLRQLIAAQSLTPEKMELLSTVDACDHTLHESSFCQRCRKRFGCDGRKSGDSPVFGIKILSDGQAFIDPLRDDQATMRFSPPYSEEKERYSAYAGFICRGHFHRFTDNPQQKDGAERLWGWIEERLKKHHGIWKENAGLYLKELEWKYNHRALNATEQAMAIAELMPADFLDAWSEKKIALEVVQSVA